MHSVRWEFYPHVAQLEPARAWIELLSRLQKAPKTVDAYARGLDDLITFVERAQLPLLDATRGDIAMYVNDLATRLPPQAPRPETTRRSGGLAASTIHQRLTVARLWYGFLIDTKVRADLHNPVGRGSLPGDGGPFAPRERALVRRHDQQPWIPGDGEWEAFLAVVLREESLRNQAMVLLAYDGALRRSELVQLAVSDIDWPAQKISIRPEITKTGRGRVIFFGEATQTLLLAYLQRRRQILVQCGGADGGVLFLSESHRTAGRPLSQEMWNKIIARVRARAGLPRFKTHTFRHLRLTDLARCQLEIYEIAQFAGHRSVQSTQLYINLHPADLARRVRTVTQHLDQRLVERVAEARQTSGQGHTSPVPLAAE
jgi:site-specific recombinase XerD